jgi:hypothetical protein
MKFYVLRLVDWLPNAVRHLDKEVRQTNQPKHIKPFLLRITYTSSLISGDNNFTDALSGDNNFICRSSAR